MKLHDFLGQQARPAPTRTVTFRIMGNDSRMVGRVATATAEIAFVPEGVRQRAIREAEKAIAEEYAGEPVPADRREDERSYHILFHALRDKDDVRQPFADSVKELKGALVLPEAQRLWSEYKQFEAEEFPEWVDGDTFEKLVEEAKKNSLSVLLSSFGFDVVRRSMPGVIARLAK